MHAKVQPASQNQNVQLFHAKVSQIYIEPSPIFQVSGIMPEIYFLSGASTRTSMHKTQ